MEAGELDMTTATALQMSKIHTTRASTRETTVIKIEPEMDGAVISAEVAAVVEGANAKRPGGELLDDPSPKRPAAVHPNPQNETVLIHVGQEPNTETFTIHNYRLCLYSRYFRNALKKDASDQQKIQSLNFPQTSPAIFKSFSDWAYSNSIKNVDTGKFPSIMRMIQLWLLGDTISCPKLQNAAMTGLCSTAASVTDDTLSFKHFDCVYRRAGPDSPLRKWLIDHIVSNFSPDEMAEMLEEDLGKIRKDMLADLVIIQMDYLAKSKIPAPKHKNYFIDSNDHRTA